MFQIMTDGFVFSKHETLAQAESEMDQAKSDSMERAANLREQAREAEEFADSLEIETA